MGVADSVRKYLSRSMSAPLAQRMDNVWGVNVLWTSKRFLILTPFRSIVSYTLLCMPHTAVSDKPVHKEHQVQISAIHKPAPFST